MDFNLTFAGVRLLALIFSVYMVMLSVYPCYGADCAETGDPCAVDVKDVCNSESSDSCTPFCIDGCCIVHIYCQSTALAFHQITTFRSVNASHVRCDLPVMELSSIWQPPRN